MSRENVGIALKAMEDDAVRSQVAAGDLSVLGDLEFNDAERAVVVDAADDFPDTTGFSFSFGALDFQSAPPKQLDFARNGRFGEAAHYAYGRFAGPNVAGHVM
jgi:hypothetical protein